MPKFAIDPEARSFEDLCLHAQILLEDIQAISATVPTLISESLPTVIPPLVACVDRLTAQVSELAQRLALTTMVAPHDCGICDAPLTFVGWDRKYKNWICVSCGWWHTAKDCCETPEES